MPGSGRRWGPADPSSGSGRSDDWPAGAAERDLTAAPGTVTERKTTSEQAGLDQADAEEANAEQVSPDEASTDQASTERANTERANPADRGRIALTGRGAIAGMLLLFLLSLLVANWLQWGVLAGPAS